jgi:hypothetical protein
MRLVSVQSNQSNREQYQAEQVQRYLEGEQASQREFAERVIIESR